MTKSIAKKSAKKSAPKAAKKTTNRPLKITQADIDAGLVDYPAGVVAGVDYPTAKKTTSKKSTAKAAKKTVKTVNAVKSIKEPVAVKMTKTAKAAAVKAPTNEMHQKVIALLSRPEGATRADLNQIEFPASSVAALRIAERHGFKVRIDKKDGEFKRYIATKAGG
jgi:valyl-tRNA synthetase